MGKGRIAVNALSSEVEEGQRGRSQERRGAASRSSSVERSMSRDGQSCESSLQRDSHDTSTRGKSVSFKEEAEKSASESAVLAIVSRLETDVC